VIGDAYSVNEVEEYVAAARGIQASYPESHLVIVPKTVEGDPAAHLSNAIR
jgi:hypothetical protein